MKAEELARHVARWCGSGEGCGKWAKLSLKMNLILICYFVGTEFLTALFGEFYKRRMSIYLQ